MVFLVSNAVNRKQSEKNDYRNWMNLDTNFKQLFGHRNAEGCKIGMYQCALNWVQLCK